MLENNDIFRIFKNMQITLKSFGKILIPRIIGVFWNVFTYYTRLCIAEYYTLAVWIRQFCKS